MNKRPDRNTMAFRLETLRASAIRRGILFKYPDPIKDPPPTESEDWFGNLWQRPCIVCGAEIETIGVTRIHNTGGYEAYNLVACCAPCNREKSSKTLHEYEQWRRSKGKIVLD